MHKSVEVDYFESGVGPIIVLLHATATGARQWMNFINDYKNQLQWKEEMIDLVKPKWYDNKYLWFFGGMIITSGSVYLAGQIK